MNILHSYWYLSIYPYSFVNPFSASPYSISSAYREKVAYDNQRKLIEEEEMTQQKEREKKEREKKKSQKKKERKQQIKEKLEKKKEEKEEKKRQEEEQRKKLAEEQRKKREEEKKKKEQEELAKKVNIHSFPSLFRCMYAPERYNMELIVILFHLPICR